METRANYAIIGVFTLAVISAAFGFVYWFSGTESGKNRTPYRVQFTGSVAGLAKGAAVLFNGIRVGDVTDVTYDDGRPDLAFATIEVQPQTPVKQDTKASLSANLLSGAAVIALSGGRSDALALAKPPNEPMATIVAEPSGLGGLLESAAATANKANALMDAVNGLVSDNRTNIQGTLTNVRVFSDALAANAAGLDRLLASVSSAAERVGPLAGKLEVLTDEATGVTRAFDRQRVGRIVENVDGLMQTVGENRARVGDLMQDASSLVRGLNDAAPRLNQVLADAGRAVAAVDPVKLSALVDNASQFTGALANSSRDAENAIRNANSLTAKLDAAAGRIDGVLKAAENFLGSAAGKEGKDTFESIRNAAAAFQKASENLDRRATDIANGVTRFTSSGSKQLEGVGVDARRTINDVGRAARNLDRNPSSVIFGGRPSLPEYGGR